MLGRKQPDEVGARQCREERRRVSAARVHGGLMGHQAEATAPKQGWTLVDQDLEARADARHAHDTSSVA
jgi:hypothetical protein